MITEAQVTLLVDRWRAAGIRRFEQARAYRAKHNGDNGYRHAERIHTEGHSKLRAAAELHVMFHARPGQSDESIFREAKQLHDQWVEEGVEQRRTSNVEAEH